MLPRAQVHSDGPQAYDPDTAPMDGYEATTKIRSLERPDAKTVPIIAMTANAFEEDVQNSLAVGMNAHLSKPIDRNIMYSTLVKFITAKKSL